MTNSPCTAIVGKGGVGKTTLTAFTIRHLLKAGITPILAVDADPSVCLAGALGVEIAETIGGIREDTRSVAEGMPAGVSKHHYLELKVQEAITEASGFDLLTMGRPEGPGCYCFVNNLLRDNLDRIAAGYRVTVIDCEAGLEHISRRTSRDVDTMILVADPTLKALETLQSVLEMADDLNNKIERKLLILNRVPREATDETVRIASQRLDMDRFEAVGIIPEDEAIFRAELEGKSLLDIDEGATSYQSFMAFIRSLRRPLVPESA